MWIRRRTVSTISNAWLVRVLADSGEFHSCIGCGSRMFVAPSDGLCPACRNTDQERDASITGIVEEQLESLSDVS